MRAGDIIQATINILNEVLSTSIPSDFNPAILGNISIRSILHKFGSNAFSIFNSDFTLNIVPLNENLHEIKERLVKQTIKDNKIIFSKECI
jgi:hypothetical protein